MIYNIYQLDLDSEGNIAAVFWLRETVIFDGCMPDHHDFEVIHRMTKRFPRMISRTDLPKDFDAYWSNDETAYILKQMDVDVRCADHR